MPWWAWTLLAWVVGGGLLALLVGKMIKMADKRG
jgi:hypothetical protein